MKHNLLTRSINAQLHIPEFGLAIVGRQILTELAVFAELERITQSATEVSYEQELGRVKREQPL